ncbi:Protein tpx2 [Kappamyces sp. JEL0829]|nr:Protein tpx2 [Kappamyces sp. JEL0829]
MVKSTPKKTGLKGGAQRVAKQAPPISEDEEMEGEATPTAASVRAHEFDAPKYQDFTKNESENNSAADAWFENRIASPQDPTLVPRNLLAEGESPVARDDGAASREPSKHVMVLRKRSTAASGVQKKTVRKAKTVGGMTIPKPFHLATAAKKAIKSTAQDPKSPFVPLALKLQGFEKQVADRKPRSLRRVQQDAKLTQPRSPMLSTKLRAQHNKATTVLTTEEKEELEFKKIAPFKARPLNKRVWGCGNTKVLESRQEMVSVGQSQLTIPMSPAIQKPKPKPEPGPPSPRIIKANPVPNHSNPFVPVVEHRALAPSDFQLPGDVILEKKRKEFLEKAAAEEKELARQRAFKANPIAIPEKPFAVTHSGKTTEPAPFSLLTDVRGERHQLSHHEELLQREEEEKRAKEFRANPLPAAEPFVPSRSNKPATEIQSFTSHLDLRMEERKAFEEEQLRKKQQEEASLHERQILQEMNDKAELRKLRREQTHKAQPIRAYANVEVKPSDKKLTEPKTPAFVRRQRGVRK